jgi:ribosomal-protein-alanine N-acetyltransferase
VFLEVGVTNQGAIALYKSFGFEEVGKRAAYYQHTDGREDALTMRRRLA